MIRLIRHECDQKRIRYLWEYFDFYIVADLECSQKGSDCADARKIGESTSRWNLGESAAGQQIDGILLASSEQKNGAKLPIRQAAMMMRRHLHSDWAALPFN